MKKLVLTIAILVGLGTTAFAEGNSYASGFFLFNLFNSNEDEEKTTGLFENDEINELMWDNVVSAPSNSINYGGGGLFGRGKTMSGTVGSGFREGTGLFLPPVHGADQDQTPLGSGIAVLVGLGAAYALKKGIVAKNGW